MSSNARPPLDESLSVVNSEDIYHNDEWWRSVVRYQFDQATDHEEIAVYLWHDDDGWTRKNKYVIKTLDAWEDDKVTIERLFTETSSEVLSADFPVSDYYELDDGETVFQSNDWWKAILKISQKGSYETEEVMVYLWQKVDNQWRRRQKFTLKNQERWKEEKKIINSVIDNEMNNITQTDDENTQAGEPGQSSTPDEFVKLNREMNKHLSKTNK